MSTLQDVLATYTSQSEFSNLLSSDRFGMVMVESFDVTGDGVTDDSTGVQSAIDYAISTGSNIVALKGGKTYAVSGLTDTSSVTFIGQNSAFTGQSITVINFDEFVSTAITGLLANLTTTNKTTLVDAINEVDANSDTNAVNITTNANNITTNANNITTLDGEVVKKTGDQTIAGIKTYSSFPVTPSSSPISDYQVSNKKYVDDELALVVLGSIPDNTLTEAKMANEMKKDIPGGVTSYDKFNTIYNKVFNNEKTVNELLILAEIDAKVIGDNNLSKFYVEAGQTFSYSNGSIDFTKAYCTGATQGTNTITVSSMLVGSITDFTAGMEVTLQDGTNKEVLTISSVSDPTITFTGNIVNTYSGEVNLYRSNIYVNSNEYLFGKYQTASRWDEDNGGLATTGWETGCVVGTKIYVHGLVGGGGKVWIYDTSNDTWDQSSGDEITDGYPFQTNPQASVGTDFYARSAFIGAGRKVLIYDTLTNIWDESTGASASGSISQFVAVGTKIYCKGTSDKMWKYDTVANTFDESSGGTPSGDWTNPLLIGTKIYCKGTSDKLWSYDTTNDTWDESSLSSPSGAWSSAVALGNYIYCQGSTDTSLWKYDTTTDTWYENTEADSSEEFAVGVSDSGIFAVGNVLYSRGLDVANGPTPKRMFKYDTVSTPTTVDVSDLTSVDVRLNISPKVDSANLSSFLFYSDNFSSISSSASIVDSTANESYSAMTSSDVDLGTDQNEKTSIISSSASEDKVNLKYVLNRSLTTDDAVITKIYGGVD